MWCPFGSLKQNKKVIQESNIWGSQRSVKCSFTAWQDNPVLGALISIPDSDRVLDLFWEDPQDNLRKFWPKGAHQWLSWWARPFPVRSDHPWGGWPLPMDLLFSTSRLCAPLPELPRVTRVPGPHDSFLMPEDFLPSLHDQASAKPLFLWTQLQHVLLRGMVVAS